MCSTRQRILIIFRPRDLIHDGTLKTLSEQFTSESVYAPYIAGRTECIRRTAPAAEKLCPAVRAFRARVYIAHLKFRPQNLVRHAFIYIARFETRLTYELMTRIELSLRRDGKILGSRSAAGYPLIYTRSVAEIYHIMVECERSAFALPLASSARGWAAMVLAWT